MPVETHVRVAVADADDGRSDNVLEVDPCRRRDFSGHQRHGPAVIIRARQAPPVALSILAALQRDGGDPPHPVLHAQAIDPGIGFVGLHQWPVGVLLIGYQQAGAVPRQTQPIGFLDRRSGRWRAVLLRQRAGQGNPGQCQDDMISDPGTPARMLPGPEETGSGVFIHADRYSQGQTPSF